ncbi:MAG: M55 family metallopeptidase [Candidatus Marsarchaeota archaeon]|nr:M55 family metallopeptidase [Candidatus Marsarchaeota archaeon]
MSKQRVYLSVDMEGITGVVSSEDVAPGKMNYERFRHQMTKDVNSVITGLVEAGAEEVVVNDSHGNMQNIVIEELHPMAQLISGVNKPLYMMEGIDDSFRCAMFVGYHSMATGKGVLSHTMSGVTRVKLNGKPTTEGEINAMIAGHFGVPVTMVSGDQYTVSELRESLGDIEGVVVKYAIERASARCLHPSVTTKLLTQASKKAWTLAESKKPYEPARPIEFELEFNHPGMAYRAGYLPFVEPVDARTVRVTAGDAITAWRMFWSTLLLGRSSLE